MSKSKYKRLCTTNPLEMAARLAELEAENEELKAEVLEQARVNGMGGEREAGLRARVEELTRKLAEYQAILAKINAAYSSGEDIDASLVTTIQLVGDAELKAFIAKEREEATDKESDRWVARLNFIHATFDVDGSGVDSGDNLDVIESEIKQALEMAREEGRKEAVPEGWQVVPKEPTERMITTAFRHGYVDFPKPWERYVYKVMLAAAPSRK